MLVHKQDHSPPKSQRTEVVNILKTSSKHELEMWKSTLPIPHGSGHRLSCLHCHISFPQLSSFSLCEAEQKMIIYFETWSSNIKNNEIGIYLFYISITESEHLTLLKLMPIKTSFVSLKQCNSNSRIISL